MNDTTTTEGTMKTFEDDAILLVIDSHGIYQAQYFAEIINRDCITGVSDEQLDCLLLGPDEEDHWEDYWDVWCDVMDNAKITDPDGTEYYVHHDGDIWLVPVGVEVPEMS